MSSAFFSLPVHSLRILSFPPLANPLYLSFTHTLYGVPGNSKVLLTVCVVFGDRGLLGGKTLSTLFSC